MQCLGLFCVLLTIIGGQSLNQRSQTEYKGGQIDQNHNGDNEAQEAFSNYYKEKVKLPKINRKHDKHEGYFMSDDTNSLHYDNKQKIEYTKSKNHETRHKSRVPVQQADSYSSHNFDLTKDCAKISDNNYDSTESYDKTNKYDGHDFDVPKHKLETSDDYENIDMKTNEYSGNNFNLLKDKAETSDSHYGSIESNEYRDHDFNLPKDKAETSDSDYGSIETDEYSGNNFNLPKYKGEISDSNYDIIERNKHSNRDFDVPNDKADSRGSDNGNTEQYNRTNDYGSLRVTDRKCFEKCDQQLVNTRGLSHLHDVFKCVTDFKGIHVVDCFDNDDTDYYHCIENCYIQCDQSCSCPCFPFCHEYGKTCMICASCQMTQGPVMLAYCNKICFPFCSGQCDISPFFTSYLASCNGTNCVNITT